ncbi:MAG: hypothetical protein P4L51_07170 [Puia sp.]|nr:hypothetical protein [Puia sp.]
MKKFITGIAIVIAVFSASSLYAQRGDTAAMRQRMEAMNAKMKSDLKLTDVQADSISAIQHEFQPQVREIFMDQSLGMDDKRAKIAPLNEARDKRIQAVLGNDLFKKYQDWMQQNRPQRGGGGGRGGNG